MLKILRVVQAWRVSSAPTYHHPSTHPDPDQAFSAVWRIAAALSGQYGHRPSVSELLSAGLSSTLVTQIGQVADRLGTVSLDESE